MTSDPWKQILNLDEPKVTQNHKLEKKKKTKYFANV